MTPEKIFDAAIELPTGSRADYLNQACQGDPDLRARVEKLIEQADKTVTIFGPLATGPGPEPGAPSSTNFGRYELLGQIGSGSMGIVYRACDTALNRVVALKVMRPESQLNEEAAERFRREARAYAHLNHPSIVTVYDLGEEPGGVYIAMASFTGTSSLATCFCI